MDKNNYSNEEAREKELLNHLKEDELTDYFENKLPDEAMRIRLGKHLDMCLICAKRLQFLEEVTEETERMNTDEIPDLYYEISRHVLDNMEQGKNSTASKQIMVGTINTGLETLNKLKCSVSRSFGKLMVPSFLTAVLLLSLFTVFFIGYRMGKGNIKGLTEKVSALNYGSYRLAFNIENSQLNVFKLEQEKNKVLTKYLTTIDLPNIFRSIGIEPPTTMMFPESSYKGDNFRSKVHVVDLNNDGQEEIIFGVDYSSNADLNGWVFCFSKNGDLLWHFKLGGDYKRGKTTYPSNYIVSEIIPSDLDNDGVLEVICIGAQVTWSPRQIVILKFSKWEIIHVSEYWHPGAIIFLTKDPFDFDNDGEKEIVVGGTCNSYKQPVLIVLKESLFKEQTFNYSLGSTPVVVDREMVPQTLNGKILPTGGFTHILRFPNTYGTRDALEDSPGYLGTIVSKFFTIELRQENIELRINGFIMKNGHWEEIENGAMVYRLDFDFNLGDVYPNQPYMNYRGKLENYGWLSKSLKKELEDLRKILYWNGTEWDTPPTEIRY